MSVKDIHLFEVRKICKSCLLGEKTSFCVFPAAMYYKRLFERVSVDGVNERIGARTCSSLWWAGLDGAEKFFFCHSQRLVVDGEGEAVGEGRSQSGSGYVSEGSDGVSCRRRQQE